MRTHDFLLDGYLHCAECGEPLERESAKGNRYSYYNHAKSGVSCTRKRWRAEHVEATVLTQLLKLGEEDEAFDEMIRVTENHRAEIAKNIPQEIEALEQRLEQLKGDQRVLFVNLKTKSYARLPQSMLVESKRLENEISEVEETLSELRIQLKSVKSCVTEVRTIKERLKGIRSTLLNPDRYQTYRHLKEVLQRVELCGDHISRALLFNTPKSMNFQDFVCENRKKRSQSSSATALDLRQRLS